VAGFADIFSNSGSLRSVAISVLAHGERILEDEHADHRRTSLRISASNSTDSKLALHHVKGEEPPPRSPALHVLGAWRKVTRIAGSSPYKASARRAAITLN